MTDRPTPTDAELKAMWQIHAADIGGTPATGGEPAGTVGYTVHGTQYVNWRTKPPAHVEPLYTTQQPTQAQAGAVPLTNEQWQRITDLTGGRILTQGVKDEIERVIGIKGGQHVVE